MVNAKTLGPNHILWVGIEFPGTGKAIVPTSSHEKSLVPVQGTKWDLNKVQGGRHSYVFFLLFLSGAGRTRGLSDRVGLELNLGRWTLIPGWMYAGNYVRTSGQIQV